MGCNGSKKAVIEPTLLRPGLQKPAELDKHLQLENSGGFRPVKPEPFTVLTEPIPNMTPSVVEKPKAPVFPSELATIKTAMVTQELNTPENETCTSVESCSYSRYNDDDLDTPPAREKLIAIEEREVAQESAAPVPGKDSCAFVEREVRGRILRLFVLLFPDGIALGRVAYYYHLHESTPWLMTDGSEMFEKIEMLTEGVVTSDDGSIVTFDWKRLVMRSGPPVPPSHYEKLRRWHTENPSQVKMILNRALEFSRWYGTVPDAWYDIEIPEAWQLLRQLSAVPAAGTDSFAFMESESLFYDRPGDEDLNGVAYLDTTLLVWLFPNGIALGHTAYYYSCHKEPDYGKHRCFANCSTGNTAPCHKKDLLMEGVVTSIKGCIVTFDWNRAVAKESPGSCGSSESLESWRGNDVVQSLESWREVDIPPLVQFDKTTCETCSECRLEENPEWQRFKKFHQAQECSWSDTWYTLKRAVPLTAWQLLRQSTLVATLFSCREKRYGQVVVEFGLLSGETVQIEVPLENTLATVAALLCSRLNKHCHVRIVGLHGECLDGSRPIRDYTNQQLSIEPAIGPVRTLDCSIRASNCP